MRHRAGSRAAGPAWLRARGRAAVLLAAMALAPAAHAQVLRVAPEPLTRTETRERTQPGRIEVLQGTLRRVAERGAVRLAYREDALPFSFLGKGSRPTGYSIAICREIVDDMAQRLGRPLVIEWLPVTAAERYEAIRSGRADLECGSSTATSQRRREVAFSPPIFVTGTRLLVPRASELRGIDDLDGAPVAVVEGTTAQETLQAGPGRAAPPTLLLQPGYHKAYAALVRGEAQAMAADEVLLYGLLTYYDEHSRYRVVGRRLSYEVYGIVYARRDPQMAEVVTRAMQRLAASRRLEHLYRQWFIRRLPDGGRLNLPMSDELRAAIDLMALPPAWRPAR